MVASSSMNHHARKQVSLEPAQKHFTSQHHTLLKSGCAMGDVTMRGPRWEVQCDQPPWQAAIPGVLTTSAALAPQSPTTPSREPQETWRAL